MINIYYCVESIILSEFIQKPLGKTIILISPSNLDKYADDDCLIVTQNCPFDLSQWKGMIVY
jgi:hypothetical protein